MKSLGLNSRSAFILIFHLLIFRSDAYSQHWFSHLNDPTISYYQVESEFDFWRDSMELTLNSNSTHEEKEVLEEAEEMFGHWATNRIQNMDQNGYLLSIGEINQRYRDFKWRTKVNRVNRSTGIWKERGPFNLIDGGNTFGIGLVQNLAIHPFDSTIIYAGTVGGLWKSIDEGNSWIPLSDSIAGYGISLLEIDPTNGDIIYVGVGSFLLKSIDGGGSWDTLSLNGSKLLIHPLNTQILYLQSTSGIMKSIDGGDNWSLINSSQFADMVFKINDPSVMYAVYGKTFYRSFDLGISFIADTTLSSASVSFGEIGMTPADTNCIYLYGGGNYSYIGQVAVSFDDGNSFTLRPSTSNNFGLSGCNHIFVSRRDKNKLVVGGAQVAKSNDGGITWAWATPYNYNNDPTAYVHPDTRYFLSSNKSLWIGNDGGISKSTNDGTSWINKTNNLNIGMFSDVETSLSDTSVFLAGADHDSHLLHNSSGWINCLGGDGYNAAANPNDAMNIMGKNQYGYSRSFDQGLTYTSCFTGLTESTYSFNANFPVRFNNQNSNSLFLLVSNVWKSTNKGATVTQISNFPSMTGGAFLYVCPVDSNIIYTENYRTLNGGSTWTLNPKRVLAVDPDEPNKIWARNHAYDPYGIFFSNDGGISWVEIPAYDVAFLGAFKITPANNTANGVYLYRNYYLFYKDENLSNWIPVNDNLPYTIINDVEVPFGFESIVRIATFGRGIWEGAGYVNSMGLTTDFVADKYNVCPNDTIHFFDNSISNGPGLNPVYNWSFSGGNPSNSSSPDPMVTYPSFGNYDVQLILTNDNGTDTIVKNLVITVDDPLQDNLPFQENFEASMVGWNENHTVSPLLWNRHGNYGGYVNSSAGLRFYTDSPGSLLKTQYITTPKYDLTLINNPALIFDYFYNYDAAFPDTLRIFYTTDCGLTKNYIYEKGGNDLMTATGLTIPTLASHWKTDTISLSSVSGYNDLQFGFEGVAFDKCNLAIDNINIGNCIKSPPPTLVSGTLNICENTIGNFVFDHVPSSLSYQLSIPFGWNSNEINDSTYSIVPIGINDSISISSVDKCGVGEPFTFAINVDHIPQIASQIIGEDTVCENSSALFFIDSLVNTGTIQWTFPSDWSISGSIDNDTLNVIAGQLNGNVSFQFSNACASLDTSIYIVINPLPGPVGTINTDGVHCENDTIHFFTAPVGFASGYDWIIPVGWNIINGNNTNEVDILVNNADDYIYLNGNNSCGIGLKDSLMVSLNTNPDILVSGPSVICPDSIGCFVATGALNYFWNDPCGLTWTTSSICLSSAILDACGGNYLVKGIDGNGCEESDTITIIVTPFPLVNAGNDLNICEGDTVQLNGFSNANYAWYPSNEISDTTISNPLVYPVTSTIYFLQASNNGCGSLDSVYINVAPYPIVTFQPTFSDTICSNYGLQLLDGAIPSGGIFSGPGVTGNYFDPMMAGVGTWMIYYTYTDANECTVSVTDLIYVSDCLGIGDDENGNIKVYPNPVYETFFIEGIEPSTYVELYDASSRLIYNTVVNDKIHEIRMDEFSDGIYLLKISGSIGVKWIKLIKE